MFSIVIKIHDKSGKHFRNEITLDNALFHEYFIFKNTTVYISFHETILKVIMFKIIERVQYLFKS